MKTFASSFADPADIRAFKRCKAQGHSDDHCFAFGDNGKGCWGDDTLRDAPLVALPKDDLQERFGKWQKGRGALVKVKIEGVTVVCEVRDCMPWKKNIHNGAGIDLAPGAQRRFNLKPPFLVPCTWEWAREL